jgi:hypothetical protein
MLSLGRDEIRFSPELVISFFHTQESQLSALKVSSSGSTSHQIDFIESLNIRFPTRDSIDNSIETVLVELKQEISDLDELLYAKIKACQEGGEHGDLERVKSYISGLVTKIAEISENSAQTGIFSFFKLEQMVHEITKDIKSLDLAKANLTETRSTLYRLDLITAGLDRIKGILISSPHLHYKESSKLMDSILALLKSFAGFKAVPQIKALFDSAYALQV